MGLSLEIQSILKSSKINDGLKDFIRDERKSGKLLDPKKIMVSCTAEATKETLQPEGLVWRIDTEYALYISLKELFELTFDPRYIFFKVSTVNFR